MYICRCTEYNGHLTEHYMQYLLSIFHQYEKSLKDIFIFKKGEFSQIIRFNIKYGL